MSATDIAVTPLTPLALEMKAYFRARLACLRADPPCPLRPCARHHAEAATALGSVPCEACRTLGIVAHSPGRGSDGFDPCEDCDGYGRTWPTAAFRCDVPGCDKPPSVRGYCRNHYEQWRRHGDPLGGRLLSSISEESWTGPPLVVPWEPWIGRFLSKIVLSPEGCWGWTGPRNPAGYATARHPSLGTRNAHRLSFMVFVGPIPEGFEVDHLCFNRPCTNPADLEAVTHEENVRRREVRRQTCKEGHLLVSGTSQRRCPICDNAGQRRRRATAAKEAPASVDASFGVVGVRAHPGASVRPAPATPPSTHNRPPALNEGPAEGATAIARTEGTR